MHVYSVTYTRGSLCRLCPARLCVILVCMVLFNVSRARNIDRTFVAFPTQFVMLHQLTELYACATPFLGFGLLDFV